MERKDNQLRCIQIAIRKVRDGNYEDAIHFLESIQRRRNENTETIQELINDLRKVVRHREEISKQEMGKQKQKQEQQQQQHNRKGKTTPETTTPANVVFDETQTLLVQEIKKRKNFYSILNVKKQANDEEIKRAYKRLLLQLHPDKNSAPDAPEAFQMVSNAFNVLSDKGKRKIYDAAGACGTKLIEFDREPQHYPHVSRPTASASGNKGKFLSFLYEMLFGQSSARVYGPGITTRTLIGSLLVALLLSCGTFMLTQSTETFSLMQTSKFNVRQLTQRLRIPYYVKANFHDTFRGNKAKLERTVEEQYVTITEFNCKNERKEHEINDLIEKLKATSVSPSGTADCTTTLLSEISATKDPKLFDKHELAELFLRLTKSEDTNVRKEAAKCIAEITKSEIQRKKFTKCDIIEAFLNCLRELKHAENMELPIQICRALGNICYLNDEARDIILDLKGDEVLVNLLDITEIHDTENALQFIKVRGGLLSNYLLGGEGLAKRAMELNIMMKLQKIIALGVSDVEKYEDLLLNTLPLLSILTENVADLNFEANLNIQLSRILAASTNPDLAEMCLELLHYQAENDDVKLLLAKDGLCETIYNLLEKYKTLASTSEARALMKLACELIVLILTGDESMHFLYSTPLLKNMEDWLDSHDIDLLTTGVLALGNFARTDSHCIYMVENKIMTKLLDVLAKNNGVKDDVRLQHALLSALRNLVIPKPNKNAVIQAGLVETILPMLEIHQPPVVFKLLGTLRMTVDGQEKLALDLLKNKTLIEQLVHWSKSSDYAGVTGESLRLMAWLIKHGYLNKITYALPRKGDAPADQLAERIPPQNYDRSSLREFITNDGTIEAMISMLTSQHLVMQNEALIALCILSVVFLTTPAEDNQSAESKQHLQEAFIRFEVGRKLSELIKRSSDTMTKEIVENLQNFINLLKTSPKLIAHLDEHNINELLKTIPILTEYCTL